MAWYTVWLNDDRCYHVYARSSLAAIRDVCTYLVIMSTAVRCVEYIRKVQTLAPKHWSRKIHAQDNYVRL